MRGGAFDAEKLARDIRDRWESIPKEHRPKGATLARAMDLKGESAWTKRTKPGNDDFKPFRVDELSHIVAMLYPGEPWRPFVDDTTARIFRDALRAKGLAPPPPPWEEAPPAPPSSASSGEQAAPKRRKRGNG